MEIEEAFFAAVRADFPGMRIEYPGVNFTPPATGYWLQLSVFRNAEANQPLANRRGVEQGVLQIVVATRPGGGTAAMRPTVNAIKAAYRKGRAFASGHRIVDNVRELDPQIEDSKLLLPVSMSYSA